ncbi:hypothetical protein D3C78_959380 [compost metagenome]
MMIVVAELAGDHHQVLGVVRQHVFPGQADAPMQLDALIGDEARRAADDVFGSAQRAATLFAVRLVGDAGGQQCHRNGLVQLDAHVDHAMLQRLEAADRHAELLARLQVVQGQSARGFHAADRFRALRGDGAALLVAQSRQCLPLLAEQRGAADEDVVQVQVAGLAAVHGGIFAAAHARAFRVDQEQADALLVPLATAGAGRYQDQLGAVSGDHHRLVAAQLPATGGRLGTGPHVVQLVMTLRLVERHGEL